MNEYFVPLETLLPAAGQLPLIGPLFDLLKGRVGVRDYSESWNDQAITVIGECVVDGELVLPIGGFSVVLGKAGGGLTAMQFQLALERRSVIKAAIDAGISEIVEADADDADPIVQMFVQMDAFPTRFRLSLSGAALSLRLPQEHARLGETITTGADVTGIREVKGPDGKPRPVDISLPEVLLVLDTDDGLSISLPEDQVLAVPPMMIADSEAGILVKSLKVDLSATGKGIPEVVARPGFDQTWKGVYIGALAIYGLDRLLPFLPSQIEATNWIIGTEGWSGAVDVTAAEKVPKPGAPIETWHFAKLGLEFDRGNLVRGTVGAVLRLQGIHEQLPDKTLELDFSLRHNPALTGVEAWGFEVAVLTPGTKDSGILTLDANDLSFIEIGLAGAIVSALGKDIDLTSGLMAGLLTVLAVEAKLKRVVIERITLDALRFRSFTELHAGQAVRFFDISFDIQMRLSFHNWNLVLLTFNTDRPVGVDFRGLTLRWALKYDSHTDEVKNEVKKFAFLLEPEGGVTFDIGDQALMKDSFLEIFKFGMGRWKEGIWIDIGVRSTARASSTAMGGAAARLFFLNSGDHDHTELQGLTFTLLIPEVIYAKADLSWGDVMQVWTRAMIVGNGTARLQPVTPDDPMGKLRAYTKRSSWFWDVELFIRWEKIKETGETSLVASADLSISSGIPLGSCDVSIFGIGGFYANDAAPAVIDDDWRQWFMGRESKNRIIGPDKWKAKSGGWGFGASLVLGSTHDLGRTWNAKAGLTLLFPGPIIIIAGAANILQPRPSVGDETGANYVALIVIDCEEETLTVGFTFTYSIPDDGRLLTLNFPTELFADFTKGSRKFHLYLGKHLPLSERVTAQALGLFNISGYLMFDTETIANLAGSGVDVPGFAIALGGRAEWEHGLRSGKLKCSFKASLDFNLAVGLHNPTLFWGQIKLEGGLVVKVFGFGFQFSVWAMLTAKAPHPYYISGSVGISIDLPWPLPDFNPSIDLTFVDDGTSLPDPGSAAGDLTIHPGVANKPVSIAAGGTATEVPVDAVMSLSFRFPIRNEATSLGSFNFDSTDLQSMHTMSGGQGYVFRLTGLTLSKVGGAALEKLPAIWRMELSDAPGGKKARTVVDLLAFKELPTSRYLGTSATYTDELFEKWDPCPASASTKKTICYFVGSDAAKGLLGTRLLTKSGHPDVEVSVLPPPANAALLISALNLDAPPAEIIDISIGAETVRALRVPGTFTAEWLFLKPHASQTLVLTFERALGVAVAFVRWPGVGANIEARFFNGATLVAVQEGIAFGALGQLEEIAVYHPGPVTRVEITARGPKFEWKSTEQQVEIELRPDIYLAGLCLHYEAEIIQQQQNDATKKAWSDLWSDLLDQKAGSSDALLLDPDSTYELSATIHWTHIDENNEESGGGDETVTYTLVTESAVGRKPPPLRKRNHQLPEEEDRWEIDTVPGDGTYAMYSSRPIRLIFSDARVEAVQAKFGLKLVLRLIDDKGEDLFQQLEFLKEHATDLPEYAKSWQEKVLGASCTPDKGNLKSLWEKGTAVFALLLTNREYSATIHAAPLALDPKDFAKTNWTDVPAVHNFKFRTSRWQTLTQHAAAHIERDEVLDFDPDFAGIAGKIGTDGVHQGDELLDEILDLMFIPWRKPPGIPEATLIWRKEGETFHAVALLLDGPEPLIREEGSGLDLAWTDPTTGAAAPVTFAHVLGRTGARSLLIFTAVPDATLVFAPLAAGILTVKLTDHFADEKESPVTEEAGIVVTIPAVPASHAPETNP
jgi:hypothetical protein